MGQNPRYDNERRRKRKVRALKHAVMKQIRAHRKDVTEGLVMLDNQITVASLLMEMRNETSGT